MMLLFEEARERIVEAIRQVQPVHLALIGLVSVALLLSIIDVELTIAAAMIAVLGGLLLLWSREFLLLMQAPDDAFPGRMDKPIWALALLFLPPIGLPAFWVFRKFHWPEARKARAWPHDGL